MDIGFKKSKAGSRLRLVPATYGDFAIFFKIMKSKFWKSLYTGQKFSLWGFLKWIFNAKLELFSLSVRSILRYDPGRNTGGIITMLWSVSLMICINADHFLSLATSFIPYVMPLVLLLMSVVFPIEQLQDLLFISVKSDAMMVLWMVSFIAQFIHIVRLYGGWSKADDKAKRGESWLMKLVQDKSSKNEYIIQFIFEPVLVALIGFNVWVIMDDLVFFLYMVACAICLMGQEGIDGAYRYYKGRS